jgi:uncharacterized membrane protein (UPF0127 family)
VTCLPVDDNQGAISGAFFLAGSSIVKVALALGVLLAFTVGVFALQSGASSVRREALSVETAAGLKSFQVEVVREEADRNRGLMYRRSMAESHGMLFDYDPPQAVGFWMKNTYIPLDIIFVGPDGRIIRIAEQTVPFSLEHIPSGGVTRGVLEINGGLSRKLGIRAGDLVRHPIFGTEKHTDGD